MRRSAILYSLIGICFSSYAQAQSSIVDASRRVDWSQAGVSGGIPNRTTVCATFSPGATAAQINAGIAACPAGQVVKLNAGTYNLTSGINFANHSNVTLRGAGPDQTFLVFSNGASCFGLGSDVCVTNGELSYGPSPSHAANWTGGYAVGTTSITLSSTAGLSVGGILILDQLNDSADTGNVYVSASTSVASDGPGGAGRTNRAQQQIVKVTGISGSTVTITPGLYMPNWRAAQSPGAWGPTTTIVGVGIEDLSLNHAGSTASSGFMFMNAYDCWVKNVRDLNSDRSHVWLYEAAHITVRDSYFYGTHNASSQSYGIEFFTTSDNLIENNIFQHIVASLIFNGGDGGSVCAYNYTIDDFYSVSPGWMMAAVWGHAAGTSMELFEGNDGPGIIMDTIHGTHSFATIFRNFYLGWETGKTAQTIPVHLYAYSRYMNVLGNVLGKSGYHNHYEDAASSGTNADTSIHVMGWSGNEGSTSGSIANDALVKTTLFRWGNYDVVTGGAVWNANEVPSGLSLYRNAVPGSQSLPSSLYLSVKPSWWGTAPWPAIGPDVTAGQLVNGFVYKIPARLCYEMSVKDGSGILTFNAAACYATGTGPTLSAPTNLRIIR